MKLFFQTTTTTELQWWHTHTLNILIKTTRKNDLENKTKTEKFSFQKQTKTTENIMKAILNRNSKLFSCTASLDLQDDCLGIFQTKKKNLQYFFSVSSNVSCYTMLMSFFLSLSGCVSKNKIKTKTKRNSSSFV